MEVKYGPEIEGIRSFLDTLSRHKKVTFVTTSTRSPYVEKKGESPKSSQLARHLAQKLKERGVNVEIFDAAKLKIYECLGCVSEVNGNHCGSIDSKLDDKEKNPNGLLRCWLAMTSKMMSFGKYQNPFTRVRLSFSLAPRDGEG